MTVSTTPAAPSHPGPEAQRRPRSATWREEALARADRLRSDLVGIRTRGELDPRWVPELVALEVEEPLDQASEVATYDRMTPLEWWSGSQVEGCWRRLRRAEEGIFQLSCAATVPVRARAAEGHGTRLLAGDDPRLTTLRTLLSAAAPDSEKVRVAGLEVLRAAHEASDGRHRQMRSFRNQLFALSAVLVAFALLLLTLEAVLDLRIVGAGLPTKGGTALVMLFGMIGALFSAVPSLATAPETSSPFTMVRQQALLKVTAGAWSAVIGLLVVDSGLAAAPPDTSSAAGILIVAALFGAGQEAVTRFADHKADNILSGG